MTATALLLLLPPIAIFALASRRRLTAVMSMGLLSLILAAVYLLARAPDVAITEAAIGAALVTLIYLLAIRRSGRLSVVCSEVPQLFFREGKRFDGLEHEILAGFAHELGLDLVVSILPHSELREALGRGEAEIAAGGIIPGEQSRSVLCTTGFLPTAVFRITGEGHIPHSHSDVLDYMSDTLDAIRSRRLASCDLDLARFIPVSRLDLTGYTVQRLEGREASYSFLVASDRPDLRDRLTTHIESLKESGELERMIARYLR
jgi:energy-converting hydrogenase B subunit D